MENGSSEKVSFSHHRIHIDIAIDAPLEVVWSVLTDTANYDNWAAFLVGIKGEIKDRSRVTVSFQLDASKEKLTTLDHTITVVDGSEFY
ncbi:SRPBCC family protein [uncultured Roseobacter sp.]|uniref:SRPBCC family protein n=1 Tax=uncultured Roseobacter sp. TaxID=114847 RepID=UPI00261DC6C2|nr:SRPBCC family protein [uncultured Roseobacter sp.]